MADAKPSRVVSIRFSEAELAGLQSAAEALGGMATLIRACVNEQASRRQQFLMLAKIYGMVEVIADWCKGQPASDSMPVRAHLLAIERELTRLTRQMERRA